MDKCMPIWEDILTDTDRAVIKKAGYGWPRGLGIAPALMIVDPQYNYCGEKKPILEQLSASASVFLAATCPAVENVQRILFSSRSASLPIIYTRHIQKDLYFDGFAAKTDRDQQNYLDGSQGTAIISELEPRAGELVVDKSYASAFYGTPLLSYLIKLGVDTLLVTGGTTSGCVRSLCVDAISRNFNVAVLEDALHDRISASHKAGLLDLWMKYCDVILTKTAMDYVETL